MWNVNHRLQVMRPALLQGAEECMLMHMTIISTLFQITGEDLALVVLLFHFVFSGLCGLMVICLAFSFSIQ